MKNKLKLYKNVCKNYVYWHVKMSEEFNKKLK